MKVWMDDNCPHRFWVTSESEGGTKYLVELGEYELGLDENGNMKYNGACGVRPDPFLERINGCSHFAYYCESKTRGLRNPENMGKVFRCKHIKAAREFALDALIPYMVKHDPNMPNEHQT